MMTQQKSAKRVMIKILTMTLYREYKKKLRGDRKLKKLMNLALNTM